MAIIYTNGTPKGLSVEMTPRDAVEQRVNIMLAPPQEGVTASNA
jgi:hypothetical protein